jgi:hypothetical protein
VYCLDLGGGEGDDAVPMTWSSPNLKGKGPSPRFDHCATLFPSNEKRYFTVFGGQDNTQIFREVHYLDIDSLTWQEETGMSPQMFDFEVCVTRANTRARLDLEVHTGWASPSSRGLGDGDALETLGWKAATDEHSPPARRTTWASQGELGGRGLPVVAAPPAERHTLN